METWIYASKYRSDGLISSSKAINITKWGLKPMSDKIQRDAVKRIIISAVSAALDHKKKSPKITDSDATEHVMKNIDSIIDSVK